MTATEHQETYKSMIYKYPFKASVKVKILFYTLLLILVNNPLRTQGQHAIFNLIDQSGVEIDLRGIPGFVESQGMSYTNLQDIDFQHWILAERYGDYNFHLLIDQKDRRPKRIEVLYHKDFNSPNQQTEELGVWTDDPPEFFPLPPPQIFSFDLDNLDGTQMGVIEILSTRYVQFGRPITTQRLIPIVVTGARSVELPALGAMVTPQIPHIVLHDPPGDGSYSTFKERQKVFRETSTSYEKESGAGSTFAVKGGIAGEVSIGSGVIGVAIPFQASVEVSGNFHIIETTLTETTTQRCLEITNKFNTSALPGVSGEDADIFIGYGETWLYGVLEEIEVPTLEEIEQGEDTARVNSGLAYARDTSEGATTTFILTAGGIQNDIENQMSIANDLSNSLLTRTRALNQVKVWQDVLDRNASNIATANEKIYDYLFSGTTSSSFDEKLTIADMTSISVDIAIETSASINSIVSVGANAISGGSQVSFNLNEGITTTSAEESSKLIGYTLEDDDQDDLFNVEAYRDPTYGTPIFRVRSGTRSSCPYEVGYRLDQPSLQSEDIRACSAASLSTQYIQTANLNDPVNIRLDVCNNSIEERDYVLELVSNANNAIVELGGESIGSINSIIQYPGIPANDCWQDISNEKPLLTIINNPNSNVDNAVLVFNLYPACEAPNAKEEGSLMVLDITFGKPNPKADMDCDGCAQEMVLNALSGSLNGTYVSEQKIVVQPDAQFEIGGDVTLDAPEVEVLMDNNIPITTSLSIINEGCSED